MTSINNVSLQQFSSLFNSASSNSISDEYKKDLLLARISREDKRESTQNYVENVGETAQEEQNVSRISDEVTISQPAENEVSKPKVNTPELTTNANENNQTYDNNINQLKARKNSLQRVLNRLHQQGNNQVASPNREGDRETTQEVDASNSPTNRLTTEEAPLTKVLKRQINELEQEINKGRNEPTTGENVNSTNGLSLSQLVQKKTRLEQQLKSLEQEMPSPRSLAQGNNYTATASGETVEEGGDSNYQNHLEASRIKQEIRNLESDIDVQERKRIIDKTQAVLATTTEDRLLDIEV